jgi:hypothetical protein
LGIYFGDGGTFGKNNEADIVDIQRADNVVLDSFAAQLEERTTGHMLFTRRSAGNEKALR